MSPQPKVANVVARQLMQRIAERGLRPEMFRRLKISVGKTPQMFASDPIQSFIDHVWVMPFYEDDLKGLVQHLPVDNLIYGSDWPHPEGFADPEEYINDLKDFSEADQRKIMSTNLRTCAFK